MKKRVKGLISWWLVFAMIFSSVTVSFAAETAEVQSTNASYYIGSDSLFSGASVGYRETTDLKLYYGEGASTLTEQVSNLEEANRPENKILIGWKLWGMHYYGDLDAGPIEKSLTDVVTAEDVTTCLNGSDNYYDPLVEPHYVDKYIIDPQPTNETFTVGGKEYNIDDGAYYETTDVTYQWHLWETVPYTVVSTVEDETTEIAKSYIWKLTFSEGKWLTTANSTYSQISIAAQAGDTIDIKFDSDFSGSVRAYYSSGDYEYNSETQSYRYTMSEDGDAYAYIWPKDTSIQHTFTMSVLRSSVGESIVGETGATLTSGVDGNSYLCQLTFGQSDDTVDLYSDAIEWGEPEILHEHPICGDAECASHGSDLTFDPWTATDSLPTSGSYYLTVDVTLSAIYEPSGTVNLCLNGHTVSSTWNSNVIYVESGNTLNICDCTGTGKITSDHSAATINVEGTASLHSGTVENKNSNGRPGIALNSGSLTVTGGTVTSSNGSGIGVYGGTLILSGAPAISGATADFHMMGNDSAAITIDGILNNVTPYSVRFIVYDNLPSTIVSANATDYSGNFVAANSVKYGIYYDSTSQCVKLAERPSSYTVTFNANGGTCETASAETVDGKLATLPDATRVGYIFNGWFDAAEGGNKISTETEFTTNKTVYAQWTAYAITQQPTVDNEYEVVVNPSAGVTYTWHEMTETPVTTENADIYKDEGYSSSYTAGWWSYHSTEGTGTPGYFSIDLNAGDMVEVELSRACTGTVRIQHYYDDGANVTRYQAYKDTGGGNKASLVAPAAANYELFVSVHDDGEQPTLKAKVIKAGEAISGQTTNKLTDGTDGTNYVAKITYPDSAVLTSEAVCYVSPSFDVTFDTDGGTTVSKQTVDNGGKVEEPAAPTKTGYTFAGWYKDSELETAWDFDTDTVTEPTTLYAKWTANTNTPYVVNHWVQTLDAAINEKAEKNETNYTLNEDENLTGTTDATFKANTKEIDGFKAPDKENITIAADGSTVHNYYYTRNKYNIVINTDEGVEELSGDGQYYYEQAVEISATLKSGYKWNEWIANETGYGSANISYSFNMPATALVLSPKTTSKAEVSINTDVQSYTYDKSAKAFEIRETDLTGFTVSYEQNGIAVTPINAGFYDVILSRAEDENYKEYSKTLVNGLIINKVIVDEPLIIDKPYNGLAQTADISDTEIYEVTENAGGTNVGAYDVVLTLKDSSNYKWSLEENSGATATRKFFITFTENTWDVEPQITGWTFGQEPSEPTFDAKFGEVVVEYKKASEEDSSYTTDIPENAGDYKVKFTVEANTNFGSLSEILDLTIAKAIPSLEAPTAQNDITYGAALSTVGLTEGWTWLDGTTIPTVQNSGFVAYFTPADTANYDWTGIDGWNEVESRVEKTVSVTVTKADSSIAAAPTAILNLEYDGSAKALVNAGTANGGTMQYSLDGTTWSTDIPTRTDAGVYDVHYKVTGDANHNDNEGGTVQVTIAKAAPSLNAPETITNLIYNGTTQPLTTNGTVAGGEIQFSTSENGTYAPAIITGENAGNYEVWYKVIGDSNHTDIAPVKLDISIAQKSVEGATVGTFVAMTYTENAQTPAATVTIDGLTATGTWSAVTNVNDKTTFTANGNFTGTITEQSTGMAKATPTVTAPVAKNNLVYNTSALVLTDAGSTTGGTMQYSLDNISWSNDIPSGTNAGDYTIYYRVVGNSNYNDVAAQSIPVSIANANMSADITAVGYNAVFDNQAHTISVNIPEGASIKYGITEGTYNLDVAPEYTNAGTSTVYYKVEKANYNAVTGSADVVITAKDIVNAEITLGEALTYTGSELTRDFTVALLDGIEVDYTVSGNTGTDAGDYELTINGQGNFTGSKSASWSIAKATQSAPETPVAVNETIKAKADGKITGVTSDMEYKLEGASEYIAISETEIVNLAAGTYLVRYKENANHLAGADKQLIIADGAMITVSFNSNEGTAVDSITCEYNQAITAPAEPTKENFVFAGWYKDAECLDLWNFGNALTEDITLYAKWNDKPVYSVSGKVTDGEFGLGGITVTLKQGNTIIATTTTAADGSYSFITEDGLYNIVAEKEENDNSTIKTVKIEVIESANVNDVVFVATDINSELEIKPDTPQIIVGGLDEEAQTVSSSNGNVDVTVKMTVESAEDITGSDDATGQEQRQTEQKEIKKVSGNRYIQFIEINLTQSISGAESTKLEETSGLIEIIIPFEKGNKRNITVYRYHGSASEKLGAGIGNANADGEYFEVKENHIVVYAKKFSTYAIGYDLPSSGGGGSSVTRYTVKFDTNGGSSVSSATVTKNAKVAEPKTPEKDGYTFGGWYTDKEFAEKYDFESKVTKNFTLYAKWDKHDDEQSSTDTHNCPSLAFDDLDITKWYHFDTDYVIENGIFKGTTETTFEPDSAQTRAMMVTVLYRVEGEPAVNRSIPFADVDMGAYYANAVIWGQQNGIIKGYSETEFGPDDKITREQIAAIMHRYAQYKGFDVTQGGMLVREYNDYEAISDYALSSMTWAVNAGLLKGKGNNNLAPQDNATRAEIAAILHRFIEAN